MTYLQDVSVAAGDAVRVLLHLILLLCGLVAFIGAGVLLSLHHVGHEGDELLQRCAELPLLVLLQPVIQSLVDHDPQRLDHLDEHRDVPSADVKSLHLLRLLHENQYGFVSLLRKVILFVEQT